MKNLIGLGLTILMITGCGDLFMGDKKDKSISLQAFSCDLDTKAFSKILEHNIKGDIICLQEKIHSFIDLVKTDRPGYISEKTLVKFVQNGPLDLGDEDLAPVIEAIFDLTNLILGGDRGYISRADFDRIVAFLIEFNKNIINVLKKIKKKKFLIFIISNQPDYALGLTSLKNLKNVHNKINTALYQKSILIKEYFYSFRHKKSIKKNLGPPCFDRKPNPFFINKAIKKYNLDLRLTPNQDILLCNIPNKNKGEIQKSLSKIGYENLENINEIQRHALACPALPLCGLAMTEAERILPDVLTRIENLLLDLKIQKTILFRMTGCPNGCTRPYMAELALVGSGQNKYQLWLGGSKNLQRLAKPFLQRMELNDLEKTLKPLFDDWRNNLDLDFGDFINTQDENYILNLLNNNQ